jgi:hypothetical protein
VGIGSEKRAKIKSHRSTFWKSIVNKYGYIIDVAHKNISFDEAKRLEIFYINRIGRRDLETGPLVNLTDGGSGKKSHIVSQEIRDKISKGMKGKSSIWLKGRKLKESSIKLRTSKVIGQKRTPKTCKKISDALKNSEKQKAHSLDMIGKKRHPDIGRKISVSKLKNSKK